jgi:hypothetical protein
LPSGTLRLCSLSAGQIPEWPAPSAGLPRTNNTT